jgi:hypothetical protein
MSFIFRIPYQGFLYFRIPYQALSYGFSFSLK